MFIKNFISGKICSILVIILKIQYSMMILIKKLLAKWKWIEFIGLTSKLYPIRKIDGSESSTAKGVNIATEFNEFKDVLFNKKNIRYKMKRIQAKKHKIRTYDIDKISLSCFDDKRQVLDGVHTLAYFHKDSVTSCKKTTKDCAN